MRSHSTFPPQETARGLRSAESIPRRHRPRNTLFTGTRRRRSEPSSQPHPRAVLLALHVSALDRLLGQAISDVRRALLVQSVLISRQNCAREALEAATNTSERVECPNYLVDPLGSLGSWPEPYVETPRRVRGR